MELLEDFTPEDEGEEAGLTGLLEALDTERPEERRVARLRESLEGSPALWGQAGDLGRLAKRLSVGGLPRGAREAALRQVEALEGALGHAEAPKLEQLLIEQVSAGWLQVQLAELMQGPEALGERARAVERRLSGAHRRYMKAIETLARVRRLTRAEGSGRRAVEG